MTSFLYYTENAQKNQYSSDSSPNNNTISKDSNAHSGGRPNWVPILRSELKRIANYNAQAWKEIKI